MTAPVLVLGFRRPDLVALVMARVSEAQPPRLFLACDGPDPDRPSDAALVAETRRVMEEAITWPCEVSRRYLEVNQGCRAGVQGAIDWFFEHVDEGIIVEDDCVPHVDFFGFCTQLLDRYREHPRVMHISGDGTVSPRRRRNAASYEFASEALVWGWATWRQAWNQYDRDLAGWAAIREDEGKLRQVYPKVEARTWWTKTLNRLHDEGIPDTWDYQWSFTVAAAGGLAIVPMKNLITNVGHREDSTHTFNAASPRASVASSGLGRLLHPESVALNVEIDSYLQHRLRGFGKTERSSMIKRLTAGLLERTRRVLPRPFPAQSRSV